MKRFIGITLLVASVPALAGIDATVAKKELDAIGKKVQAAFAKEDAAFLANTLADNFVWKHKNGRPNENKKQTIDGVKQLFAAASKFRIGWVVKSFSVKGNTAVVVASETMNCKVQGQDKKSHTMKSTGSVRETWVKTAKGWKATMFEDMGDEKMWMDGKPFDPKAMGGG